MANFTGTSGNDTINGTAASDNIQGLQGADIINAAGGDDIITVEPGIGTSSTGTLDDTIDGGTGEDTVVLSGNIDEFSFVEDGSGRLAVLGNAGTPTGGFQERLTNVEMVEFNDANLLIVDPSGSAGSYTTIQAAVDAASSGDTIIIKSGTYREQVVIDGKDNITLTTAANVPASSVIIESPDSADLVVTDALVGSGFPVEGIVTVENSDGVTISNLTIAGRGQGNSDAEFTGISFTDSQGGTVDNVTVSNVFGPLSGGFLTDGGRSIYAGFTSDDVGNTFSVTNSNIFNFAKSGIVVDTGTATIVNNFIDGFGLQPFVAQNGIEVFEGSGLISQNTIQDIGFTAGNGDGSGIAAAGVSVIDGSDYNISNNVINVATGPSGFSPESQPLGGFQGVSVVGFNGLVDTVTVANNVVQGSGGEVQYGLRNDNVSTISVNDNEISDVEFAIDIVGFTDIEPPVSVTDNVLSNVVEGLLFEPDPLGTNPFTVAGTDAMDFLFGAAAGDSFDGGAGDDSIRGFGGNDTLIGGDGNDLIFGDSGADSILGGDGNDSVAGGSGGDVIFGNAGDDELEGEGGNDTVIGGAGNDILGGGDGADSIQGGANDDDIFGDGGNDTLLGNAGEDVISGNEGNDSVNGGQGNDSLFGDDGVDTLLGAAGNDLLDGGSSADSMAGGTGDDNYFVDNANDVTTELANEGFDIVFMDDDVFADPNLPGGQYILQDNIDGGAFIGDGAFNIAGNALGNEIVGGGLIGGQLFGRGGDDTLIGSDENDTINGNAGSDEADGQGGDDLYFVNLLTDLIDDTGSLSDTDEVRSGNLDLDLNNYSGVENATLFGNLDLDVTGDSNANVLTGNLGANVIAGGDGNDTLIGGAGNDTLNGEGGRDASNGGAGNDIYIVDDVNDTITDSAGFDTVVTNSINLNLNSYTGVDGAVIFAGDFTIIGNGDRNFLQGSTGSNAIVGDAGDDTILGGAGNDTLVGDDGNDSVSGGNNEDLVVGGAGLDTLNGNGGDDTLSGGAGNDTLNGGAGNDLFFLSNASSTIADSAGTDVAVTGSFNLDLNSYASVENGVLFGALDLNLTGSNISNRLRGNDGDNQINGQGGNDSIEGGAGADTLVGAAGDDTLFGDAGRDILTANSGDDVIAYRDISDSGPGAANRDIILTFTPGDDLIDLEEIETDAPDGAFDFIGTAAFSGTAGELRFSTSGGNSIVQGDADGDGVADFELQLNGVTALTASDFIL